MITLIKNILEPSRNSFLCSFCYKEMNSNPTDLITSYGCKNDNCIYKLYASSLTKDNSVIHVSFDFIETQYEPYKRILVVSRYVTSLVVNDKVFIIDKDPEPHTDVTICGDNSITLRVPLIEFHHSRTDIILNKVKTFLVFQ